MKDSRGSTLVELLAVLLLLALLTLMVFPNPKGREEEQLLEATARTIAMHMRLAQGHAVATNTTGRLVFYVYSHLYYLELSGRREWIFLPDELAISAINFPLIYNRRELSFNPLGVPNQGGHLGLRDREGNRIYVIITPVTGRVRISRVPPGH